MGTVPCQLPDTAFCTVPFTGTTHCQLCPQTPQSLTHPLGQTTAVLSCFTAPAYDLPRDPGPTSHHFLRLMESQRFYQGQLKVTVLSTPHPQQRRDPTSHTLLFIFIPLMLPGATASAKHQGFMRPQEKGSVGRFQRRWDSNCFFCIKGEKKIYYCYK